MCACDVCVCVMRASSSIRIFQSHFFPSLFVKYLQLRVFFSFSSSSHLPLAHLSADVPIAEKNVIPLCATLDNIIYSPPSIHTNLRHLFRIAIFFYVVRVMSSVHHLSELQFRPRSSLIWRRHVAFICTYVCYERQQQPLHRNRSRSKEAFRNLEYQMMWCTKRACDEHWTHLRWTSNWNVNTIETGIRSPAYDI